MMAEGASPRSEASLSVFGLMVMVVRVGQRGFGSVYNAQDLKFHLQMPIKGKTRA